MDEGVEVLQGQGLGQGQGQLAETVGWAASTTEAEASGMLECGPMLDVGTPPDKCL